ncbi:MAG: hypothetical protein WCV92_03945 [Candidatus Buchananbacteria bacterium]
MILRYRPKDEDLADFGNLGTRLEGGRQEVESDLLGAFPRFQRTYKAIFAEDAPEIQDPKVNWTDDTHPVLSFQFGEERQRPLTSNSSKSKADDKSAYTRPSSVSYAAGAFFLDFYPYFIYNA